MGLGSVLFCTISKIKSVGVCMDSQNLAAQNRSRVNDRLDRDQRLSFILQQLNCGSKYRANVYCKNWST